MRMLDLPVHFVKVSIKSKQALLLTASVVSVISLLLAVSIFAIKRSSAHVVSDAEKNQQDPGMPATARRMVGTYYTTENGFQSTLVLNNKRPYQIMVTPVLHGQNGQTFTAPPVAVGGQSSSEVDLNALASTAGPRFQSGSFEFTYEGKMLDLGGGLTIVDAEKSLIFDEQMLEPGMKFPSSQLEAVYAVPFEGSQVSVIVTNTTAQPIIINGAAIFAEANGRRQIQSSLGSYETRVINLPRGLVKKASAGAVSLNHNGGKGALLAMIHLQDADRGYSETVNFTNPEGKATEWHGAGLRLGRIKNDLLKPVIVVRNIGDGATTVTATVPYSKQNGDVGAVKLPKLNLAPGEIKLLDVSSPQLRQNDFDTAGLEIKYTGTPGSVIASASSVSRSGNQVFVLPLKDPKVGPGSNGGYPWLVAGTKSTVVFVKNVTNEPQSYILNIIYPGGRFESGERLIGPAQTVAIDVRKIRDSQMEDAEGDKVPEDATAGHISWGVIGTQGRSLIGRAETSDLENALISTYESKKPCLCGSTVPSEARMLPGSATAFPGDLTFFLKQTRYADCNGDDQGWHNTFSYNGGSFGSSNPSIATFDGDYGRAISPGSTFLHAQWGQEYQTGLGCEECECFINNAVLSCAAEMAVADFNISGAVNCMDGGSANFSVTVTGGTAQSYEWTFQVPSGSGNNPNPQFGSPSSASTSAKCHWFANPNQECANTPPQPSSSHPYYNSVYDIKCKVTFSDGKSKTKETKLTVNAWWSPAGTTSNARVEGNLQIDFDTQRNVWHVVGPGSLARKAPVVVINIPTSSQFRNKVSVHEDEHVKQWQTGLFSDLMTVNGLMQVLSPLTDPTQQGLANKIITAQTNWENSQEATYNTRLNQAEREAHTVSDPVSPRYAYQRCGRFQ